MSLPPILFVRHGETAWNAEGRLQGQRDIPLNGRGRAQACDAGRRVAQLLRIAGQAPEAVPFVASPLSRARETAALARAAAGLDAHAFGEDDRLRELSFGAWEGFTWPEVKAREPERHRERRRDAWRFTPPDGESYADLAERLRPWLATLREPVVVVAHGGVARALMVLVGGLSTLAAPTAEVTQGRVLRFADGGYAWR